MVIIFSIVMHQIITNKGMVKENVNFHWWGEREGGSFSIKRKRKKKHGLKALNCLPHNQLLGG